MVAYRPRTKAEIRLRLLDHAVEDDTYAKVLNTLGKGVKVAVNRIDKAGEEGPEDYREIVADEETEVIEGLLGTAYVLCQTPITAVTQAALRAREQAIKDGLPFTGFGDKAPDVRALGERFDATYSKVEVLWALGNYFKHRDEWPRSTWTNPTGLAVHTVPVIQAAGLEPSTTGNLRTGAKALGIGNYVDMSVFEDIIRNWATDVRTRTRQAFGR